MIWKCNKNFIANTEANKAQIKPITQVPDNISGGLILRKPKTVAPKIIGAAARKEYLAAVSRENPRALPAVIVAPLRETPGIMASAWERPIKKDLP